MAKKKTSKRRKPRVEPLEFAGAVTPIGVDASWTACAVTALEPAFVKAEVWQVRRAEVIGTKPEDYACEAARLEAMGELFKHELSMAIAGVPPGRAGRLGHGLVAIEGYAHGSAFEREHMGELGGYLKLLLWQAGVPYLIVPPGVLKKYVTGKGNAAKAIMLKEVYRRWGYDTESDDQADAYGLARFAAEFAAGNWTKKFDALAQGVEVVGVRG
jgi:hypothetical protein